MLADPVGVGIACIVYVCAVLDRRQIMWENEFERDWLVAKGLQLRKRARALGERDIEHQYDSLERVWRQLAALWNGATR